MMRGKTVKRAGKDCVAEAVGNSSMVDLACKYNPFVESKIGIHGIGAALVWSTLLHGACVGLCTRCLWYGADSV